MNFFQALAQRIKNIMEEKGITKSELIKKCKLAPSTIQRYLEAKNKTVSVDSVYKIARALNTPMGEFFSDEIFTKDIDKIFSGPEAVKRYFSQEQ